MREKMFYTILHHIQYIHQFDTDWDLRTIHTPAQGYTKTNDDNQIIHAVSIAGYLRHDIVEQHALENNTE